MAIGVKKVKEKVLENNVTFTGTASDTETEIDLGKEVLRVSIWAYDYDLKVCRSSDGTTYQDWIEIKLIIFIALIQKQEK